MPRATSSACPDPRPSERSGDLGATLGSLPAVDVRPRLERLRERLAVEGLGTLVVSGRSNVRYLSGFTGSAGILVVGSAEAWLVTDGRYGEQAETQLAGSGVRLDVPDRAEANTAVARHASAVRAGGAPIGVEAEHTSWAAARALLDALGDIPARPTTGLVEALRREKEPAELERIEAAASVADAALGRVVSLAGDGVTERELADALERALADLGSTGPAFPTIVASGPRAAMPHAEPTTRAISPGELVIVDYGAVVDGYRSDATRTLFVGEVPVEAVALYEAVAEAQAAGIAALRAGVTAGEVDAAAREVLAQLGLADAFVHPTGHGVGLDIHEEPILARGAAATLLAGEVVTVEPGAYLPGTCGVRIEDTLVVTEGGSRPLSRAPKPPVVV